MLFVISCEDKPDSLNVRLENREAHLRYLEDFSAQLVTAGPYLSGEGQPVGSMLIMEFADDAAAIAFSENDPYTLADLFQSLSVRPWKKTLPT